MRKAYESGQTLDQFLESVREQRELWHAMTQRATLPEDLLARARRVKSTWHLLVLLEDWCGDAINTVPVMAKLAAEFPNIDLRFLRRDEHPELMNTHLTGTSRSVPVVILLDERFVERAWWGPRPAELQQWVISAGRELPSDARYREIRRWYARDHGRSTIHELLELIERDDALRAA